MEGAQHAVRRFLSRVKYSDDTQNFCLNANDPHVCRGINTCKNKGKKDSTNDCAGQGHCATVKSHSCQGTNDCKGQGGCSDNPGENDCKGKGSCAVPLDAGKKMTWQKARKRFEELMKKSGKTFGDAPAE